MPDIDASEQLVCFTLQDPLIVANRFELQNFLKILFCVVGESEVVQTESDVLLQVQQSV